MSYKLILTSRALKDLKNINEQNKKKIILKLKEFLVNPFLYSRKLSNPKIGTYRFRIGNFRVIFDIDGENIIVLRIGNRKDIYK